ncbi:beta-1,3-galactosyltransferase 5-like [Dreissena polymorpha]|uniref:Hexosyltransferase n=1 Tax=Dreissena polymorpha TaxID=45954 RepID=A0A9D4BBG0_DREPO|nr:beta-1,3-galactosyltransferase 5-like [Dreissena polymorpha]XP_052256096.1 beta-1,3-galactosyltransferase 5-like [Dreissena polymorpha]KAH3696321.1 hypothetical protein DPMN_083783 [Dreissena polymorpha]
MSKAALSGDLDLGKKSRLSFFQSLTGTLVSVELLDMRPSRTRRQSARRVILKASILSVILLSIAFIITYSVILTYVSSKVPLMRHHESSQGEKSKSGRRMKLVARPLDAVDKDNTLKFSSNRVVKWNIQSYHDSYSLKPRCMNDTRTVILITSAVNNFQRRNSIRNTWCSPFNFNLSSLPWTCVFLVGRSLNANDYLNLQTESRKYNDILTGSYLDSYRNLTVKIMHGFDWVRQFCKSDYVLKTDDDVYVNTLLLDELVSKNTQKSDVYIGLVMQTDSRLEVIRNPESRWFVSMDEYPSSHYPPYASGMGYLLSKDVVAKVVDASKYILPFANEDAYVGVLINNIGVRPVRSGRFTLTGSGLRTCNLVYLVVVHHISAEEQYTMMERSKKAQQTCLEPTELSVHAWN